MQSPEYDGEGGCPCRPLTSAPSLTQQSVFRRLYFEYLSLTKPYTYWKQRFIGSSMARKQFRRPAASTVAGDFRIFTDPVLGLSPWERKPTHWNQIVDDGATFMAVSRFVHLGMCMLESNDGRRRLLECGYRAVEGWRRGRRTHNFRNYKYSMHDCVDYFLHMIRRRFPDIYLTSTISGESSTQKTSWGRHLGEYDPKFAAKVYLNRTVSSSALEVHTGIWTFQSSYRSDERHPGTDQRNPDRRKPALRRWTRSCVLSRRKKRGSPRCLR